MSNNIFHKTGYEAYYTVPGADVKPYNTFYPDGKKQVCGQYDNIFEFGVWKLWSESGVQIQEVEFNRCGEINKIQQWHDNDKTGIYLKLIREFDHEDQYGGYRGIRDSPRCGVWHSWDQAGHQLEYVKFNGLDEVKEHWVDGACVGNEVSIDDYYDTMSLVYQMGKYKGGQQVV
jgi:hypothetical protein